MEKLARQLKKLGFKKSALLAAGLIWSLQTVGMLAVQLGQSYTTTRLLLSGDYSYEYVRRQDDWYRFIVICEDVIPVDSTYLFVGDWEYGHRIRYYLYPRFYVDGRDLDSDVALLDRITESGVSYVVFADETPFRGSELLSDERAFNEVGRDGARIILSIRPDALGDLP